MKMKTILLPVDGRVMYLIEERKTWHVWMSLLSMPWSTTIAVQLPLCYESFCDYTLSLAMMEGRQRDNNNKHIHVHAHHERTKVWMAGPKKEWSDINSVQVDERKHGLKGMWPLPLIPLSISISITENMSREGLFSGVNDWLWRSLNTEPIKCSHLAVVGFLFLSTTGGERMTKDTDTIHRHQIEGGRRKGRSKRWSALMVHWWQMKRARKQDQPLWASVGSGSFRPWVL
jgi:hypothetical protein